MQVDSPEKKLVPKSDNGNNGDGELVYNVPDGLEVDPEIVR